MRVKAKAGVQGKKPLGGGSISRGGSRICKKGKAEIQKGGRASG